jgi:hypothetical protein
MPFVDGEPIDAAKLGALETQLNQIKSAIPTFGSSTISLNTSTTQQLISSGPELEAGNTATFDLMPGTQNIQNFKFTKEKGFSKTPVVVACGRYGTGGKQTHGDINVVSVSQTGFSISCPLPATGVKHTIGINYIAIAY